MKGLCRALIHLVYISAGLFSILDDCPGGEIVVDPSGGGDFTEIQPAIDAAADGDTVLVQPGEYVITTRAA